MKDFPLLFQTYLRRTAKYFPNKEIVSVYPDQVFRYTYGDYYKRVCQLSHALKAAKIKKGDRVASVCLNNHRHLELYYGVTCPGAVLHTVNFRLPQEHFVYVINHAENKILFIDDDFLFLLPPIRDKLKTVKQIVVTSQSGKIPDIGIPDLVSYDEWIKQYPEEYDFPDNLDEKDPTCICYTSATTGLPKGVVYTQRSVILHFLHVAVTFGLTEGDCALHCVPMFHVNAWGAPYAALSVGCKQILPGREMLNMEKVCNMISQEKVTFTSGVPTIWMMLYDYLEKGGAHDFSSMRIIASGGSACPPALMKALNEKYNFPIMQAYGMTEASPLATAALPTSDMKDYTKEQLYHVRTSIGLLAAGLDMKIVNDKGEEIKNDGKDFGEICLRGPWIAQEYYKEPERSKDSYKNGWFHTGDVGTIDELGYVRLMDRTKDLIKSGGEWISSVDLENLIMAHASVAEAAVIGIPDEKWVEVPFACVVKRPGQELSEDDLKNFLKDKVKAAYWIPKKFHFMDAIPKTSVGKFNKKELRAMYSDGRIKA